MLRDKSLIPLSHQHQRALALCVRIDRAQPIPDADIQAWEAEIAQIFDLEIKLHFAAEEEVLFPAARQFPELAPLVDELMSEHTALRQIFSQAAERQMSVETVIACAQRLSAHIRKEERLLFERMQQLMRREELATLGLRLESALKNAAQTCVIPNEATRLKAKR